MNIFKLFVLIPGEGVKGPSVVVILKWGGELTPAGKIQAEEMGKAFRAIYPGGQGQSNVNVTSTIILFSICIIFFLNKLALYFASCSQIFCFLCFIGQGFLRLHSTFRHDLKIYASDEGRVQMTAAAFTKVYSQRMIVSTYYASFYY